MLFSLFQGKETKKIVYLLFQIEIWIYMVYIYYMNREIWIYNAAMSLSIEEKIFVNIKAWPKKEKRGEGYKAQLLHT